ncbi:MAG: GNAT family N-acetyltransferase [Ignavibacteriales bacterium]|nr:GNAT family N-acetyltransferase [Ignavibacteriales bacterium]
MTNEQVSIRKFQSEDKPAIIEILKATNVFSEEEITIAIELMDEFLQKPHQEDYDLYSAVSEEGQVIGYYCAGPTPLTHGTFDLYWIAVKPDCHKQGVGRLLNTHCEELVKSLGGKLIVAETSSKPNYEATRRFYHLQGYQEVANIKNYYKPGDDLVIFGKYVQQ